MAPHFIKDATWLDGRRVGAASAVLLALILALAASVPWTVPELDLSRDFAAFWTAGWLALEGNAAGAYGEPARQALAALLGPGSYPAFFYPPNAFLLFAPFGALPFGLAATLWIMATGTAYALAVRALSGQSRMLPVLAYPAVAICAVFGQNSLLTAALLAGAALALDRRPVLAGVLIGALAFKPQVAILLPLALGAAGRWQAFRAAAVVALAQVLLAALVFGPGILPTFLAVLPEAKAWNAGGVAGFGKYISPYAALRVLDHPEPLANAIQVMAASWAIAAMIWIGRRCPDGASLVAAATALTLFCVPFLGIYELALLAVPGAWLFSRATRDGWLPYERLALLLLAGAPLAVLPFAMNGVPLGPLAGFAMTALVVRRVMEASPVGPAWVRLRAA